MTIEEAIKEQRVGFFDKGRSSGDSRPRRPHDIAPVYEAVFEIGKIDLVDEKFFLRAEKVGFG